MNSPTSSAPRGLVGWPALAVMPAAGAFLATLAYGYGWATSRNPAAIANPLITGAVVFIVGFTLVWTTRLSKLRNGPLAALFGVLAAASFVACSFLPLADQSHPGPWDAWHARWVAGVGLLPGRWLLHTGWGWTALVLEVLILAFTGIATCAVEAERPFCSRCSSWPRADRWRLEMPSPPRAIMMMFKDSKPPLAAITSLTPGDDKGILRATVGACGCGNMATLNLKWLPPKGDDSSDISETLVEDMLLSPRTLPQVLAWGEGIDPSLVARRPKIAVRARSNEPLGVAAKPEGPEWIGRAQPGLTALSLGIADEAGNDYTNAVRLRLLDGDFNIAEDALRAQRNPDDLAFVANACANWWDEPSFFADWENDNPDSAARRLTHGIFLVHQTWRHRGRGFEIRDPQGVVTRSRFADLELHRAASLASKDPTAWAWRMQAAKTHELSVAPVRELFQEVTRRAPHLRIAHTIMLECLMEKWWGSEKEMFAFAHEAAQSAGAGSPLGCLIATAHFEAAMSRATSKQVSSPWIYLADPGVSRELRAAHDRTFHAGPFKPCMDTPWVCAAFALTLWKSGQKDAAAEHLRFLNPAVRHAYFDSHIPFLGRSSIRRARRECGVA